MSFILLGILNAQAEAAAVGDYNLLETQVLSSSASSVTFASLNSTYGSTYKHLQVRYVVETDRGNLDGIVFTLNGDTGSNYSYHRLYGTGSSVTSDALANANFIYSSFAPGITTNQFGAGVVDILDPFDTSKYPTTRVLGGHSSTDPYISLFSGSWRNLAAIDSITFDQTTGPNFIGGSRFSLYGIKAA